MAIKRYGTFDYCGTGMLQIEVLPAYASCVNDDEWAAKQAIKDGIKIIPIEELPANFDRRYLGWIDTPSNRKRIDEYSKTIARYDLTIHNDMGEFIKDVKSFDTKDEVLQYIDENELEDAYERYCIHIVRIINGCTSVNEEYL